VEPVETYGHFTLGAARSLIGKMGTRPFLTDVFRFRADFEATLDARGYLDYLDEEWDVCCTPFYPVGGMSEFINRMAADAEHNGARIFLSEPALEISKQAGAYPYFVRTPQYAVAAKKLILAAEPGAFATVTGGIAEAVTAQPQFQDLVGIKVVTIAQRWPRAWWRDTGYPGRDIHRAWTTERCLNLLEIPIAAYAADQLVTRTVYDDDIRAVTFWENTARRGIAQVEDEIMRGLTYLFPNVPMPKPQNTFVQVWPAGWHWLQGGSQFTNADIAQWAIEPLPGEEVSLVGEAYNPQRSGWSDGAYKSSINTLNAKYGFHITVPMSAALALTGGQGASRPAHSRR
jgi:hypothetical protein